MTTPAQWRRPFSHVCYKRECQQVPHYDGEVYWTFCKTCLRMAELGPYRKRVAPVGEDYSQW